VPLCALTALMQIDIFC